MRRVTGSGRRQRSAPSRGTADVVLRAVVVVALVAGAALALQARQGLDWSELTDPVGVRWGRVIAGLLALLVLAAAARPLVRRLRRPRPPAPTDSGLVPPEGEPLPWWVRLLAVLLLAAGLAIAWYVIKAATGEIRPEVRPLELGDPGAPGATPPEPPGPSWPTLLMIAALLVAVALVARWRALLGDRATLPSPDDDEPENRDAAELASAVTAAETELAAPGDARAAIVAAYAAMAARLAAGLARRGGPASVADTPTELLDRAARSGLVDGEAAATLTALFREARFSRHPMGEEQRRAAEQALAQVRDELAARRA
jgi:hypothetical protein